MLYAVWDVFGGDVCGWSRWNYCLGSGKRLRRRPGQGKEVAGAMTETRERARSLSLSLALFSAQEHGCTGLSSTLHQPFLLIRVIFQDFFQTDILSLGVTLTAYKSSGKWGL